MVHLLTLYHNSYNPFDPNVSAAASEFTCGITDEFSLESLILHTRQRGLAMDSSWRNKNENRAAMTILITVNSADHMLPGGPFCESLKIFSSF